ncbi:hypothetical protein [Nitratiruptor sp. SB155-2]|uniref:hypothetical protein n=1 Tax=Nitratiruptor sp. (strain SB155-2) TaxID=387092 RepID=UPI00059C8DB1|nr:hypothetical protein [Nitratiruptor sp. SB155-2]
MRYLSNLEIVFYAGAGIIILLFVSVLIGRFKDEKIDFREHKWIIFTYVLLMILAIWVWRYMFDTFFSEELLMLLKNRWVL